MSVTATTGRAPATTEKDETADVEGNRAVDAKHFRHVLGHYPTGVVVVTATDGAGSPIGMTVGSFTSVSLDPPLVAFLPSRDSSSWRALRASGDRFCVNILGEDQEDVCRWIAVRKSNKFAGIAWNASPLGSPVIEGAVAWIECSVDAIHDAGDHEIVVGRVNALAADPRTRSPLLFRGGRYGSFEPSSSQRTWGFAEGW